jgi:digeranylgeranylglycerophospholipid reductase
MKAASDAIVIGGGPCGSFTALNLAKLGETATIFEEHGEIGVPSHCAGHLSIRGLKDLGLYPLPQGLVENVFKGAIFHSPKGREFCVRFPSPVTCVVNRTLFDKQIAKMAEKIGAHYHLNSRVDSLIIKNGYVKGVIARQGVRTEEEFSAKIVVDAEGLSPRVLRQVNLPLPDRRMIVKAVQAEVENVKGTEPDMVEVFLGRDYAPGFYAWLIPKQDGKAKVGLATRTGDPKRLLKRLMGGHPVASKKLGYTRILQTTFHPITLGGPIVRAYSNGFLAVGDAASQVKPTTGGGVIFGMTCARVAAEVAHEAMRKDDFSSRFLSTYKRRCGEILGLDFEVMLKMRRMLDAMSDEKIDHAIDLCARLGLDKSLRSVRDIDFQGRSLLGLLRSPRMLAALFYFFILYLSTNP